MQEEIIDSVLSGQDTLALLPTGGGKSLCFQVPAMAMEGVCIVVSPLIALMQDQVTNLRKKGITASAISSAMSKREMDIALDNAVFGNLKFLYVSPERLKTDLFLTRLRKMKVCLLAVDEAHCISEWGHDFRPAYREISEVREWIPEVPIIALTATATGKVVNDITERLELRSPAIFKKSFVRNNLVYVVQEEDHKLKRTLSVIKNLGGSGIVYVGTRKETVRQSHLLRANGIGALPYHGGMTGAARKETQDLWISNKAQVVVATNAFGMGIDKPDVRFVVHLDIPASPEAYFQEAGRAGRDEKKAYAILLANEEDRIILKERIADQIPGVDDVKKVFRALVNYLGLAAGSSMEDVRPFDLVQFCTRFNFKAAKTLSAIRMLEKEGYLILSDAVYNPSTLKFEVSTKEVYSFEIGHPKFEGIISTLLRSYEGLFDRPIRIDEQTIARRLKTNYGEVRKQLDYLSEMRIVNYRPHTDLPFISFPVERPDVKSLNINKKRIAEYQVRAEEKMNAIIGYSQNAIVCRSRQLVGYFGDYTARDCGKCDVCLGKKKREASAIHEEIRETLISALSKAPSDLAELVNQLDNRGSEVTDVLRWMNDNGEIEVTSENLVRLSNT